jgi:hypothetical protein
MRSLKNRLASLKTKPDMTRPASLDTAARYFGLDPADSHQREQLLFRLSELVFGKGRPGRKHGSKKWNDVLLWELAFLYERYCYRGRLSDRRIAAQIFEKLAGDVDKHKFHSADRVRLQLPAARRLLWEWNEWLRHNEPQDFPGFWDRIKAAYDPAFEPDMDDLDD